MGVYRRRDSPYWWLWLPGAPQGQHRVRTTIPVGVTPSERRASRADADACYHAQMVALARERYDLPGGRPAITVKEFAAWFETHVVAHHRGSARESAILARIVDEFGGLDVADLEKDAILEWRTRRAAASSPSTSNRELDVFKSLLSAAVPKYLEASPIAGLPRLRTPKTAAAILRHDDERRLLAALPLADRALILCALDTLMRLSDVVNLRRDQDRGTYLLVVDPKVRPYQVPVSARLRKALDALPQTGPSKIYYFGHRRQAAHARDFRSSVKSMLKRACERAGIPYGRKVGGMTFHGLRHTGATRLVEAGVPFITVFWAEDDESILRSIREGFIQTHQAMWKELGESNVSGEKVGHSNK